MSRHTRKFIALLMLLWLPLSSGSALAASLAMQLQQGGCHEAAVMTEMSHGDMHGHDMMHHDPADMQAADDTGSTSCGVCHLACTAYLDGQAVALLLAETVSLAVTQNPEHFVSHISAPLVPPPLARA